MERESLQEPPRDPISLELENINLKKELKIKNQAVKLCIFVILVMFALLFLAYEEGWQVGAARCAGVTGR